MWKKIDISKVLIQCNKDSCYEHITVGVNIYLYRCVFLLGTECAVCLWVWVYLYVCVCVRSNHTTSKKPHYLSELVFEGSGVFERVGLIPQCTL